MLFSVQYLVRESCFGNANKFLLLLSCFVFHLPNLLLKGIELIMNSEGFLSLSANMSEFYIFSVQ